MKGSENKFMRLDMTLISDSQSMNSRLRQRLSRAEFFALGVAFGAVGVFLWLSPTLSFTFFDFKIYLNTAHGDFNGYYYGYWVLPIFAAPEEYSNCYMTRPYLYTLNQFMEPVSDDV